VEVFLQPIPLQKCLYLLRFWTKLCRAYKVTVYNSQKFFKTESENDKKNLSFKPI